MCSEFRDVLRGKEKSGEVRDATVNPRVFETRRGKRDPRNVLGTIRTFSGARDNSRVRALRTFVKCATSTIMYEANEIARTYPI